MSFNNRNFFIKNNFLTIYLNCNNEIIVSDLEYGCLRQKFHLIYIMYSIVVAAAGSEFTTTFPEIFEKYHMPYVESDKLVQAWNSNPMQFWQSQVNLAVWCVTTVCGVSFTYHMEAAEQLTKTLFTFHVYCQVRRILAEIPAPLPQDQAWNAFNNPYDRKAYGWICSEFGVSSHTDWRVKGPNNGLGLVYFYVSHMGYQPIIGNGDPKYYYPARMSFTKTTTNQVLHVGYIAQDPGVSWATFILDKSVGFSQAGVERLNDSIQTYVWAILGAQAQTRARILGTGTAFGTQKQFLANIEDAISSPFMLNLLSLLACSHPLPSRATQQNIPGPTMSMGRPRSLHRRPRRTAPRLPAGVLQAVRLRAHLVHHRRLRHEQGPNKEEGYAI